MQKPKKIIILGTGGNCLDILDTINDINSLADIPRYECLGFLDDNPDKQGQIFMGAKVLGMLNTAEKYRDVYFVNGIGSARNYWMKERIIAQCGIPADKFETIIHPSASVSRTAVIGSGSVILQNVTIANQVKIGRHVIILPNTVISHDDFIDDLTCITGGACISGGVKIGKSCYLGSNCSIKENVVVGQYSLIGMGAVVLNDIPEKSIMAGIPARLIRWLEI